MGKRNILQAEQTREAFGVLPNWPPVLEIKMRTCFCLHMTAARRVVMIYMFMSVPAL